jgi:tyrosinase
MKANPDRNNRGSWMYWVDAHALNCPHVRDYFLAWHRGFLYLLEQQLRAISGRSTLMLPCWDYYLDSTIPAEFLDPTPGNPLFVANRINTHVYGALTLAPFSSRLLRFPGGTPDAFESSLESGPHGPVHNLIGGIMISLQSPIDPLFWLHHANIDRLWTAWVAAGGGRQMPASTSPYWTGSFTYNTGLTYPRRRVIDTTTFLGYRYQNQSLPTSFPPRPAAGPTAVSAAAPEGTQVLQPADNFEMSEARDIAGKRRSIGGAKQLVLDERSVSVEIPVEGADKQSLESVVEAARALPFGRPRRPGARYRSAQVVLENPRVTGAGEAGGYFYELYLDMPERDGSSSGQQRYLVGTFGPFDISVAAHHHGVPRLVFPATEALRGTSPGTLRKLTISFMRVNGDNSPRGPAIVIGEARVELSRDDAE